MSQTVLAIDDSPDVHRLLDVRLRPEGLVIHHALDAEDGIAQATRMTPDLILLDVDMPHVTGFEVCRKLKSNPLLANVPVIFLTGASEVHTKVEGFDLGAVDYVTKPFDPAELRARVRAALRTKRYHDLLAARSNVDALTGIWNRAYFNQRLGEEVAAAERYGRAVTLILMDLDGFKSLNDTYGHPFGDQVLQQVGELLHTCLRSTDAPCRYGGEEFGLVLTDTDAQGARTLGERIRTELAGLAFHPRERIMRVTASFGIADSVMLARGQGGITIHRLITAADDALYEAKRTGRDRVCIATPNPNER